MKVLQIVSDTDRRGAQVFAVDLADALTRRGHRVTTQALIPGRRPQPLPVDTLGTSRVRALRQLRREAADASVVIAHGSSTLVANALVSLVGRTPFVYRQISDSSFWAPRLVRRLRVAAYLRRARAVVALSTDAGQVLTDHLWLAEDRIVVIPNGVPSTELSPADANMRRQARLDLGLDTDRPTVAFVAALVPEKGGDLAVRMLAHCRDAQLIVAGDGPQRSELERLTTEIAPGRAHFVGSLDDVVGVYHAADLVVLPSLGGDSMPATLIEAGMCGLPAISTDVGSIAEIVLTGTTGEIVGVGDQQSFDAAVVSLLGSPDRAEAMGAAARDHCLTHFEIDVVAAAWERALIRVTRRARTFGRSS